jgi:hypothetical protein
MVASGLFLLSVVMNIAEAWIERDWPRDTFRFTVAFGFILAVLLAA